ncbi:helix-turn-helix transcriptional regulator [Ornithinimicrobium ciconiae]|uniref:Helix-turn-helix transcriptional regulator n=1 Tax=Ornithinimicrobium ciconiae TaxID=2594265 RepID=A0A516GD87_9MICO|nr:helix-turn-helix transcriptional regulator [Ornithinimicrobium ciconiae]QDO89485.1 helix-turn-helix transcriptional regulator [Ornithinimicrobium ciconiae]
MTVRFRNVDVPAEVRDWPYEAITTAIERGTIGDWAVLTREIGQDPWGPVARQVEDYLEYAEEPGVVGLFRRRITAARAAAEEAERAQVAEQVRELVRASGLTLEQFARAIGTSRPRLSTYRTGKVTPSAALLVRMARVSAGL